MRTVPSVAAVLGGMMLAASAAVAQNPGAQGAPAPRAASADSSANRGMNGSMGGSMSGSANGSTAPMRMPMGGMASQPGLPAVTQLPSEPPEKMFSDPKIAAVASISNFNEIDPSQLALTSGQSQAVKDYARQMIDDHTRFERDMRVMLAKKKMGVEDNALSIQLKRNAVPTLEMLRTKTGMEFDKAYVLQQIESHDLTLHTLDTSLIPSAKDPEMKAMLRDVVRPAVVQHLQRIKQIHDQMQTAAR